MSESVNHFGRPKKGLDDQLDRKVKGKKPQRIKHKGGFGIGIDEEIMGKNGGVESGLGEEAVTVEVSLTLNKLAQSYVENLPEDTNEWTPELRAALEQVVTVTSTEPDKRGLHTVMFPDGERVRTTTVNAQGATHLLREVLMRMKHETGSDSKIENTSLHENSLVNTPSVISTEKDQNSAPAETESESPKKEKTESENGEAETNVTADIVRFPAPREGYRIRQGKRKIFDSLDPHNLGNNDLTTIREILDDLGYALARPNIKNLARGGYSGTVSIKREGQDPLVLSIKEAYELAKKGLEENDTFLARKKSSKETVATSGLPAVDTSDIVNPYLIAQEENVSPTIESNRKVQETGTDGESRHTEENKSATAESQNPLGTDAEFPDRLAQVQRFLNERQTEGGGKEGRTSNKTADVESQGGVKVLEGEDATADGTLRPTKTLDISDAEIISNESPASKMEGVNKGGRQTHEVPQDLLNSFDSEFKLTPENLKGIEHLSLGQQKLVLENLREHKRDNGSGPLSRVWQFISGARNEANPYSDMANKLISGAIQFGPKVHEEGGDLLVDMVGVDVTREYRAEHKGVIDHFNAVAHEYSKIKAKDIGEHEGRAREHESKVVSFFKNAFSKSRNQHDTIVSAYEDAKSKLTEVLGKELGEQEAIKKLIEIEGRVQSLRFIQTEAEAVDVIKENPDQGFWKKVAGQMLSKENLVYFGLGFAGRTALMGSMSFFAGPVVAVILGGVRSWNRTSRELEHKDERARRGAKAEDPRIAETKAYIRSVIKAQVAMDLSDEERKTNQKYLALVKSLDSYNEQLMKLTGEDLNIVDATRRVKIGEREKDQGVTQKLQDLIERYQGLMYEGGNISNREELLTKMSARVSYIEDKISQNKINFGVGSERMQNMAKLLETIGSAKMLLVDAEMPKGSKVEERLEQYLIHRDGVIQTRRRNKHIKVAAWNILKAGAFSVAGAKVGEYVRGFFDAPVSNGATLSQKSEMLADTPRPSGMTTTPGAGAPEGMNQNIPSPTESNPAPHVELSPHMVTRGDNLTGILKHELPAVKELSATEQNRVLTRFMNTLSEKDIRSLGIKSGKVDLVRPGEKIDIEKLNTLFESKKSLFMGHSSRGVFSEIATPTPLAKVESVTSGGWSPVENGTISPRVDVPGSVPNPGTTVDTSVGAASDIATVSSGVTSDGTILPRTEMVNGGSVEPVVTQEVTREVVTNSHGLRIPLNESNLYEVETLNGEKILMVYGGKDLEGKIKFAQEYVRAHPESEVYVEGDPRKGTSSILPPPFVRLSFVDGKVEPNMGLLGLEVGRDDNGLVSRDLLGRVEKK